ncbi:MAG: asparagine synthase (glutamine-hydrolyzing) [Clostridiales bacterium]|jgi:asparagine synthase (glutamine-hydrolysing)|nr:asparagine synthase (glutamine-hydrolyzing) [Clostridiales bacterium]
MCGIAGFADFKADYTLNPGKWFEILREMRIAVARRGPDEQGEYLSSAAGLSQARLSIRDLENGSQPMSRRLGSREYCIVYNGELYNAEDLKADLLDRGWHFFTSSDTEVILVGMMEYGIDFIEKLNGIFAYSFWDSTEKRMLLVRDRAGVKPLFYTFIDGTLVFGSELKALFKYPGIEPVLDRQGLCEVFGIGPARTHGIGVFKGICEVKPGCFLLQTPSSVSERPYWKLQSWEHTDSDEETVEKVSYLVKDSAQRQMASDVPICSFLSGGLDSSLLSAICNSKHLSDAGKPMNTFSFDFAGNKKHFKSNSFQAEQDRPYVDRMLKVLGTNHTYLECGNEELADSLFLSVDAKDLPGMADVDASLLHFCSKVKKWNKVALTGECADEIFGGYPWFHRREMFDAKMFPWSSNLQTRQMLLRDDVKEKLGIEEYAKFRYEESVNETPILEGEIGDEKRRRELAYLNIKWFMSTLLDRMDRASMYSGLEARVPYADHRIMEYVFNVPWRIKCKGGVVKHLLRQAGVGILPDDVLWRKKSPYPKTYNPEYEKIVSSRFKEALENKNSPILSLIDEEKAVNYMNSSFDYGKPWFGQLMAGPQMIAYLLQINYWLEKLKISIEL